MVNEIVDKGQDFEVLKDTCDFYQIYYEDWQRDYLFMFAKPFFNEGLTPFFENTIIRDIVLTTKCKKVAVCSWALKNKMTGRIPPKRDLIEEVLTEDFDVMSFSKNAHDHDMLGALDVWHPGSVDILQKLWSKMGLNMPKKPKFPIYQNAFCAKTSIYKDYVRNFLIPAMRLMSFDEEISRLCNQDSKYTRTILNVPVNFEKVKKYLGTDYVPMHPFLLERCFSLWIDDKNFNVVYL